MACPGTGAAGAADLAVKFGFDGVDLRVSDHLGELPARPSAREAARVRTELAARQVVLQGLLCYNPVPASPEEGWQAMEESLALLGDLAGELGARSFRIFGGNPGGWPDEDRFLAALGERIRRQAERGSGVRMLLQHHQGSLSFRQAARLHALVDHPDFSIAFSPDHCFLMGEALQEVLPEALRICGDLYLSDLGPGAYPEERAWDAVLPGTGRVDLSGVVKAFADGGSTVPRTFKWEKVWQPRIPEAPVALEAFRAWLAVQGR